MVRVVEAPDDPRTLASWARLINVSHSTLKECCAMAGVGAKASLDLARLLRVLVQSQGLAWEPENLLDISERRTLKRLLEKGGLPFEGRVSLPVDAFLVRQSFVRKPACLETLDDLLRQDPKKKAG
jgi:hypothetical protein